MSITDRFHTVLFDAVEGMTFHEVRTLIGELKARGLRPVAHHQSEGVPCDLEIFWEVGERRAAKPRDKRPGARPEVYAPTTRSAAGTRTSPTDRPTTTTGSTRKVSGSPPNF